MEDRLTLAEDRGEGLLGRGDRARHVPQCGGREAPEGLEVRWQSRLAARFLSLQLDVSGKLYLAPLTTVGLPWARPGGGSTVSS